jgi:hypothetical protein
MVYLKVELGTTVLGLVVSFMVANGLMDSGKVANGTAVNGRREEYVAQNIQLTQCS